jgi:hypothetical protein
MEILVTISIGVEEDGAGGPTFDAGALLDDLEPAVPPRSGGRRRLTPPSEWL